MNKDTEAGQAAGEEAAYPVRNCQIERCYPSFAKPDEKNGKQSCRKCDDYYGDRHGGAILQTIG